MFQEKEVKLLKQSSGEVSPFIAAVLLVFIFLSTIRTCSPDNRLLKSDLRRNYQRLPAFILTL